MYKGDKVDKLIRDIRSITEQRVALLYDLQGGKVTLQFEFDSEDLIGDQLEENHIYRMMNQDEYLEMRDMLKSPRKRKRVNNDVSTKKNKTDIKEMEPQVAKKVSVAVETVEPVVVAQPAVKEEPKVEIPVAEELVKSEEFNDVILEKSVSEISEKSSKEEIIPIVAVKEREPVAVVKEEETVSSDCLEPNPREEVPVVEIKEVKEPMKQKEEAKKEVSKPPVKPISKPWKEPPKKTVTIYRHFDDM